VQERIQVPDTYLYLPVSKLLSPECVVKKYITLFKPGFTVSPVFKEEFIFADNLRIFEVFG
jgi:hypothetical protein